MNLEDGNLFVDTNVIYAYCEESDSFHKCCRKIIDECNFSGYYTSEKVVSEIKNLIRRKRFEKDRYNLAIHIQIFKSCMLKLVETKFKPISKEESYNFLLLRDSIIAEMRDNDIERVSNDAHIISDAILLSVEDGLYIIFVTTDFNHILKKKKRIIKVAENTLLMKLDKIKICSATDHEKFC